MTAVQKARKLRIDPNNVAVYQSITTGLTDNPTLCVLDDDRKLLVAGKSSVLHSVSNLASADYSIHVYDIKTRVKEADFQAHAAQIMKILFIPPTSIMTLSVDGTVKLWKLDGTLIEVFIVGFLPFDCCELTEGKTYIIAGQSNKINLLDHDSLEMAEWMTIPDVDTNEGFSVVASYRAKNWIAFGLALTHKVYIVDIKHKTIVHVLRGDADMNGISQIHCIPGKGHLVTNTDTHVLVWDIKVSKPDIVSEYSVPRKKIKKMLAFPESDLFLVTFFESQIFAIKISDGTILNQISAKMNEAYSIDIDEKTNTILLADSAQGVVSFLSVKGKEKAEQKFYAPEIQQGARHKKSKCCTIF